MSFEADEDILQDFLVEAGEILELLSEQLVDLENSPDDMDLLNAIFRGFHTVKGGAGFLQLNSLVDCCHVAENVFDMLRNGQRKVSTELMDVVLQALDTINEMFSQVRDRVEPTPADPELLKALADLAQPEGAAPAAEAAAPPEPAPTEPEPASTTPQQPTANAGTEGGGDITDAEFEKLLDAVADESSEVKAAAPTAAGGDEITEDEFEALLDQLHGSGPVSSDAATPPEPPAKAAEPAPATTSAAAPPSGSDEITEDEFEALLNELHGGSAPVGQATTPAETAEAPPAATTPAAPAGAPAAAAAKTGSDLITEAEFESLLDELQGSPPAAPTKPAAASPPPAQPAATAAPVKREPPAAAPPASPPKPPAAAEARQPAGGGGKPAPAKEAPAAEATVRVDTARLDDIMNMVGELVLVRNRLVRLGNKSGDEVLSKAVANLDVVTGDLQLSVMKTRMQPIKKVFGRFPRVVRDLARSLKKEINLELEGEETDLDKNLVEALADPLVHLVRNAVDHGIESPEDREKAGKSRKGTVVLSAQQEGDHILLSIADDGAGMDPDKLRGIAVSRGIYEQDAADRLSDNECYNLIFAPGFSTKTEITDISGRGVGMDVVKNKISQLNGTINIDSVKGEGSKLIIKVPLTLAIMPTLMVMLENQAFALPLVSVNEIFHLDLSKTNVVDGQEVVIVREKALPLFHLKRWLINGRRFDESDVTKTEAHVVVVSVGTQRVGFVVDQLIGQEEVVIKPLGQTLQGTPGMAGATITGDGRIALILDVPSLLKEYA
ncbi:chemotaxis protein CheA [Endozoicomonas sp. SM1973]|uniref:Chemotaxis protein CheA n=1 Tax=Spartinivicinus marinus TaxID=2994442 RepID=A0A853I8B1_9GAMM|nr:chemotaxis protein CheA [Spartinivicinus marinus]MCX4028942.1 chemotaxis protein CheA [Spartinivicinus marinus]NYZ65475.1 chemotaxis protein CheA [Spartinivicinus marinus]